MKLKLEWRKRGVDYCIFGDVNSMHNGMFWYAFGMVENSRFTGGWYARRWISDLVKSEIAYFTDIGEAKKWVEKWVREELSKELLP